MKVRQEINYRNENGIISDVLIDDLRTNLTPLLDFNNRLSEMQNYLEFATW